MVAESPAVAVIPEVVTSTPETTEAVEDSEVSATPDAEGISRRDGVSEFSIPAPEGVTVVTLAVRTDDEDFSEDENIHSEDEDDEMISACLRVRAGTYYSFDEIEALFKEGIISELSPNSDIFFDLDEVNELVRDKYHASMRDAYTEEMEHVQSEENDEDEE